MRRFNLLSLTLYDERTGGFITPVGRQLANSFEIRAGGRKEQRPAGQRGVL